MSELTPSNNMTRRQLMAKGAAAAAASVFSIGKVRADVPLPIPNSTFKGAIENTAVPRWQDPLPLFNRAQDLAGGTGIVPKQYDVPVGKVFHGVAPEFFQHPTYWDEKPVQYYYTRSKAIDIAMLPNSMKMLTPIWNYQGLNRDGTWSNFPQYAFRYGQQAIVRTENTLPEEMSVHMHGGHWPSHSDGHASFYVLPGQKRDYYYPMVMPRIPGTDKPDVAEASSSMWFHDHAADMTAIHVARGMAGTAPAFDDLELGMIRDNILPGVPGKSDIGPDYTNPYDTYLSFGDKVFFPNGLAWYDSNSHNGYIGNVETVNFKAYPTMKVEARKYRFRLHGASTARWRQIRLSDNSSFLRIGNDAFLFPKPQRTQSVLVSPGKRADIIVDFSKYRPGTKIYLENILLQTEGRGPTGTMEDAAVTTIIGTPSFSHQLMQFEVVAADPRIPNASITDTTPLRPHEPIPDKDIVARRTFLFERKNGQWAMNGRFWNKDISTANPTLNTAEEWTLKNGGGGWWHPIHIHLESHHQMFNVTTGKVPPYQDSFKQDVTMLGPNTEIKLRMRFRTFKGPFMFHCHNNEHEDMAMMSQFDPRAQGTVADAPPQQFFP